MQSKATTVDAYIQEAPAERQAVLYRLHQLCRDTLQGYEEGMDYGMPVYKRNGTGEVAFASQKNYISLYILKEDVLDANRPLLAGLSCGKGCIRYTKPEKINFDVVEKLLIGTRESQDPICP